MDIITHRNCLDGAFSAYLLYLFSLTIGKEELEHFIQSLNHSEDVTACEIKMENWKNFMKEKQTKNLQICEEIFNPKLNKLFNFVSYYAGQFLPLCISSGTQHKILIIVDITPTVQYLGILLKKYKHVLIIDHHHTFISNAPLFMTYGCEILEKLSYIYCQSECASMITYNYLNKVFNFRNRFPEEFRKKVQIMLSYINKNDLKKDEDKESKMFILGLYYLEIELSHQNPWLFKRLSEINLDYVFEKGNLLYKNHVQKLIYEISNTSIFMIGKGKYKGRKCFATHPHDMSIVSDLGNILAFLSAKMGMLNLAIITNKKKKQIKLSFRSNKIVKDEPAALDIATQFGGGGHKCASGCMISENAFKNAFKNCGTPKPSISMTEHQIQNILFSKT